MRRGMRAGVAAGLIGAALAGPAEAITINDDAGLAVAATLGAPFDGVAHVVFSGPSGGRRCSGALISSGALLTADHCVTGFVASQVTVEFREGDGTLRFTRGVSGVTSFGAPFDGSNLLDGTDLAVLTLAAPVETIAPFPLAETVPLGETVRFVGFGRNGVGSTGAVASDLMRRAAENVVDTYGAAPRPYPAGTPGIGLPGRPLAFGGSAEILTADYDDLLDDAAGDASNVLAHLGSDGAMLPLEGSGAPGDSGGPMLMQLGMVWAIAGVLSGGAGTSALPVAGYGEAIYWTAVQGEAARDFLTGFEGVRYVSAPVPLPATAGLLAFGLGALVRSRRRHDR